MRLNDLLAAAALASTAAAQIPQAIPYSRTQDLLVVDSSYDGVWRLADFDQDGDYDGPGEVVPFYTDTLAGFALTNPSCIVSGPDGTVYVGDSTIDVVLALRDQNGDGDANDPGEHQVFFTSVTNASGIVMASVQGITVDAIGRVWLAVANAGTVGTDVIVQLHDLDLDGDADDLNESRIYCTIPGGSGAVGNSIPTKVVVGPDANLYYTDVGSTGAVQKGVWRLVDLNSDGDCDDPGEVAVFWTPPFAASPFYWSLAVDALGTFYVTDHSTNEQVWQARDTNGNGTIEPAEQTLFFQSTGSTWWDVVPRPDGSVLLCDADTPDRITTLRDLNADGDANDPGESTLAYSSALAATAISPRGATLIRAPQLEITPPVVQVGNSTTLTTRASRPGDLVVHVISLGFGPSIALPPWGVVEIDVTLLNVVHVGVADATGWFTAPLAIPNVPTAVNTYAFQTLAGDTFRLFLSNAAGLTVTP
jgi:hypothetical protein